MDALEKVEKLRERANVTYEEARAALEEQNWDLLDAMVALEKAGRTAGPKQSQYSTSYEEQAEYIKVEEKVREQQRAEDRPGRTLKDALRRFFRICMDNACCIRRHGDIVFQLPLIVLVLILFFAWKVALPVMLIGLFFGFRYSFEGKDELRSANRFMDTAGEMADSFKEGFENAGKKE